MKRHPLATRERLARFPKFTQRFWTWLTAITHRNEQVRQPWTVNQHMAAFLCMAALSIGLTTWSSQRLYDLASQASLAAGWSRQPHGAQA